eukprot:snap_masked-scaffold_1-processed-gene-7.25-mRNA-1 protein AED:1.00 eAED:1.00 QI:0/0/0/0/1/1/2/0/60
MVNEPRKPIPDLIKVGHFTFMEIRAKTRTIISSHKAKNQIKIPDLDVDNTLYSFYCKSLF